MSTNSHYLVIWTDADGTNLTVVTATSRRKAAEHINADRVTVYTLPAHNPQPTTYERRTVTETKIVEVDS